MLEKVSQNQFEAVYGLIEKSFPKNERGDKELYIRFMGDGKYTCYAQYGESGDINGVIGCWRLEGEYRFIEHFAVEPTLRGKGVGGAILTEFLNMSDEPVILEVEDPDFSDKEISERRIAFYKRIGFGINKTYKYFLPPMREGELYAPMFIMSYPRAVSDDEAERFKADVYKNVYANINPSLKAD